MIKYLKTQDGEKIPFCISYSALAAWADETNKSFDDLGDNLNMAELEPLFYYALLAGARQTKQPFPDYDRKSEEYLFLIDDIWFDFITAMPDFFQGLVPTK